MKTFNAHILSTCLKAMYLLFVDFDFFFSILFFKPIHKKTFILANFTKEVKDCNIGNEN